jgi:hypothetical protein
LSNFPLIKPLLDRINPFEAAYAVMVKAMGASTLRQVAADPWEKRLAEGVAAFARHKAKSANG